ncbi:MAG: B12-binding domain-containing radical SAM protein [Promethearchaeota archaeon]
MFIDILLINPPLVNFDKKKKPKFLINTAVFPPIGLAYLAAYLDLYGFKSRIIDMDAEKLGLSSISKIIKNYNPKIIGISISADIICSISILIIKEIRKYFNGPIVIGGIVPTNIPEYFLKNSSVDFVVRGEGEVTLLELMKYLLYKEIKLKNIDGISYKKNNKIIHNRERSLIKNLDNIPFPRWNDLNLKKYFISIAKSNPCFAITASRGCPYQCIFCGIKSFKNYRIRTPQNVIKEIEYLIYHYNIKDLNFHDPCFNVNPNWVISFCKELLKKDIKINWRCLCRVDKINEKMISYMKMAGCYNISFGIESSKDKYLKFLNKNFTIKQVEEAIKIVKKYKIEILTAFIYGIPGQNIKDLEHNIKFIKKLSPDFLSITILTPMIGTKLYDIAIKNNWLLYKDHISLKDSERMIIQKQIMKIPNLTEEVLNYYIKKTYLLYFLNIKTIFKYCSKYFQKPSRYFYGLRNIIWQFY